MLATNVCDESSLMQYIDANSLPYRHLGTTLEDRGMYCIVREGHRDYPPVIITAGSHATEPAGIYAALELARRLETPHPVYVVPIRDPVGWEGYEAYLQIALQREVSIGTHEVLRNLLLKEGNVVFDDGVLAVAEINGLGFVTMPVADVNRGPMDIWKRLGTLMSAEPHIWRRLENKRLVIPENLPDVEGCGLFNHAFTAWITPEGGVANFNRLFSYTTRPPEVETLARLVQRVQPGLVIDLHESQGSEFFLFAHPAPAADRAERVYRGATAAVADAGHILESLRDLTNVIGKDHAARFKDHGYGIVSGSNEFPGQGWQFSHYCADLGAITVTTETGRWQPLEDRIDQHVKASLGAIASFSQTV